MQTKYDKITLAHNLSGAILPTNWYKHIYRKVSYSIPTVVNLYDGLIKKDAMRTELHQA